MINLLPYHPDHMQEFESIGSKFISMEPLRTNPDWALRLYQSGPALTGFHPDGIAGCAGICLLWDGVGAAWMFLSKIGEAHPIPVFRWAKKMFRSLMIDFKLHRVEATCNVKDSEAARWLLALGFVNEGTCFAYGPDRSDHYRMALLRL